MSDPHESQTFSAHLVDGRQRLLLLAEGLPADAREVPRLAIVSPPLWEVGHVAWFAERWTLRHLGGPLTLAALLLAAAPAAGQDELPAERREEAVSLLGLAREHAALQAWPSAADLARRARGLGASGSDPWLEAAALEASARYWLWEPDELIDLGEQVRAGLVARAEREPGVLRSVLGPMPPGVAGHVIDAYVPFAVALLAGGRAEDALAILAPIPSWVRSGAVPPTPFAREAALLHARARLAQGSAEGRAEGRALLERVMELFPGTTEASTACVLLQDLAGLDGYRGKYAADPRHRAWREELRACLPAARARVAGALGIEQAVLAEAVVGIADATPERPKEAGFCFRDPRRGWEPPVVALYSEAVALGIAPLEQTALHELAHAGPALELGLAYETLPEWVTEGIAFHTAGSLESLSAQALAGYWIEEPDFLLDAGRADLRPRLGGEPRHQGDRLAGFLALAALEETPGPGGIRRLLGALRAGRGLDAALEEATGLPPAEARQRAADHAGARLFAALEPARADLRALRVLVPGSEEALAEIERLAAAGPAPFARPWVLQGRAETLDALGRHEEAAAAWRELLDDPSLLVPQVETARLSLAQALARSGREEEARRRLQDLRRDGIGEWVRREAASLLAELERRGKR